MKTEQKTVYTCEYCGRKMLGKGAMSFHERYCKNNPNNFHKCFMYCKYLERVVTEFPDEEFSNHYRITEMICKKRNVKMYSYKFEKHKKPHSALNGLERMPLECEVYEGMYPF